MNRLLDAVFGGLERAFALLQVRCDALFDECRGKAGDGQDREHGEQQQARGQCDTARASRGD